MNSEYYNLDDEWINNFENTDKLYQDFYKDDLYYINLKIVYINRDDEIDKIKHETFLMSKPNYISREEILNILKNNSIELEKRYTLLSILRYNICLEPDEIKNYLSNNCTNNYLTVIKNIDEIKFDKSINMFHDLNDLILIFYEKSMELKSYNTNNLTKKIYLNTYSFKKTIKKRYKD